MSQSASASVMGTREVELLLRQQVADLQRQLTETQATPPAPAARDPEHRYLASLMQHATFGWACFDRSYRYVQVNPLLARLNGRTPEEHVGRHMREIVGDAGCRMLEPLFERVFATNQPIQDIRVVAPVPTAPDRQIHWKLMLYPVPDASGQVAYVGMTLTDETAERLAQEALEHSEERLRLGLSVGRTGIWDLDMTTGQFTCSDSLYGFCAVARDQCDGTADLFARRVHPEDMARLQQEIRQAMNDPKAEFNVEFRSVWPDGTIRWLATAGKVYRDGDGRPIRLIGATTDVTCHKEAEQRLRDATERNAKDLAQLESVLSAMTEGLIICDATGRVIRFNPVALEMHGFDSDDILHAPVESYGHLFQAYDLEGRPIPMEEWPITQALRGRSFSRFELELRRPDKGIRRIFSYGGTPVRDASGNIILAMVTIHDVTDIKRGEEELRQAKQQAEAASRAKDHFLAQLSHELRTPLAPVLMTAQAMESDPQLPESLRPDVEMIRRNVELEARLIDDLLDLTRIERQKVELHRELTDLHMLIERALHTCTDDAVTQKRLTLQMELNASQKWIWGDSARMQQVLWNLIKNAIKFTGPDGTITLRTSNPTPATVRIECVDSGVGIDPSVLPTIFNAFEQGGPQVTRRYGGLGLGLAISRALVALHGGSLHAFSDGLDCGSTFVVELPVVMDVDSSDEAVIAVDHRPAADPLRILLVEDHLSTAEALKRLLQREKWSINVAHDMRTALRVAAEEPLDLIVSDLGLPDGTGYELMAQLRQARPELYGIAVSGYGAEEDRRRSAEAGFARHIVKPVNYQMLREAIMEVATRRRHALEARRPS